MSSPLLESVDPVEQFCSNLKRVKGEPVVAEKQEDLSSAVLQIAKQRQGLLVLAGLPREIAGLLQKDLSSESIQTIVIDPLHIESSSAALESLKTAATGITWAEYGVASSGAVVEILRDDLMKLASSLPTVNVVLLPKSKILPSVENAFEKIGNILAQSNGAPPVVSLISGPSKTSDIELRQLYGVHGPLSFCAIVLGWM